MRGASLGRPAAAATVAAALGMLWAGSPAVAGQAGATAPGAPRHAAPLRPPARPALPAGQRYVCPEPAGPGQMTCMSVIRTTRRPTTPAAMLQSASPQLNGFYTPAEIRSAYELTAAAARDGGGRTVAIVDAYRDAAAASDLARYRARFGLPACTTSGGCLRIVNEFGRATPLPRANADWALEEALDLEMVSAVCPHCRILLVEAKSASTGDLGTAEDTAVAMGARYVSNSWAGQEFIGQDSYDRYFDHPGVVIDFASGDFGYGPVYPADLQYVTSIGGTSLRHAAGGRGWTESAWGSGAVTSDPEGTGSGCSALAVKASWQHADARQPRGCLNRTENDVSAVANPDTGVLMYHAGSFFEIGGTSAATPIITATYALAGLPERATYPAQYPYLHHPHLFDVRSGVNGRCESARRYLCHGVPGYDGPTGLGTPDGTAAFAAGGAHLVTVIDPGTRDAAAGGKVSMTIRSLDTRRGATLRYRAAGLPAGLSIHRVAGTANGRISGKLRAGPGDYRVTVTASDGTAKDSAGFTIAIIAALDRPSPAAGEVSLGNGSRCLDAGAGGPGAAVLIEPCTAASGQEWQYTSDRAPGSKGTFTTGGRCLGMSGSDARLATCSGAAGQQWTYLGAGVLANAKSGLCLAAASLSNGAQVTAARCTFGAKQTWWLPAGPLVAGTSLCASDPGGSATAGTHVTVADCTGDGAQQWAFNGDGTISSVSGLCLSANGSLLSGAGIVIADCDGTSLDPDYGQIWLTGPGGELINAGSGRCLADPGNAGAGTRLAQEDCYGETGEVWGVN